MATAEDYEEVDHAFVRQQIFGPDWTPDPMPSTAWRGIVQDGEALKDDPQPTSSGDPTIYGAWDLIYDTLEGCYEDVGAPVRYGRLRVTGLLQKGAATGYLRIFFRAIRRRVADAPPDGPLGFTIQEARPVPLQAVGSWRLFMIEFPFAG